MYGNGNESECDEIHLQINILLHSLVTVTDQCDGWDIHHNESNYSDIIENQNIIMEDMDKNT